MDSVIKNKSLTSSDIFSVLHRWSWDFGEDVNTDDPEISKISLELSLELGSEH